MTESIYGVLLLILVAVGVIAGLRLLDYGGHFVAKGKRGARTKRSVTREETKFDEAVGKVVERYSDREPLPSELSSEDRFRPHASSRIAPLLNALVERSEGGGHRASWSSSDGDRGLVYRLEIQRSDHMSGQPLPYITLAAGKENDVAVVTGGSFPGRRAENGHRTEIDWYEVRWADVDDALLSFAQRVFQQFDD